MQNSFCIPTLWKNKASGMSLGYVYAQQIRYNIAIEETLIPIILFREKLVA